ncbi:TetR/AcrR family transcriptional regulator [Nocardia sp. NPDC051321]|uniref:TetR/AcrR family transcriptional regulator n=1 Tax=Nocardia sp. NPDC051321 TaxID=3364323 RepID=UPI00379A5E18
MGNREALLAAARTCVYQRGFAQTTARDIATEAGVSLASIGYHFGSKERLLTEAFTQATGHMLGDELAERIRGAARDRSRAQAFADTWTGVEELFARHRDGIVASAENLIRGHRSMAADQLHMASVHQHAIAGFAELVSELHPALTEPQARAIGKLYFVLVNGLALQWISDPSSPLPTGEELVTAIAALAPNS